MSSIQIEKAMCNIRSEHTPIHTGDPTRLGSVSSVQIGVKPLPMLPYIPYPRSAAIIPASGSVIPGGGRISGVSMA